MSDTRLLEAIQPVVERVRAGDSWVLTAEGPRHRRQQGLTERALGEHVNGGPARGACPLERGGDTTRIALLDLDAHSGEVAWEDMAATAERIHDALRDQGLCPMPWRSRGGSGIHIYVLWDSPQDAYSVRATLREALQGCDLAEGTGGVEKGEVEVFPKQDRVGGDEWGSMFILPLAGESVPLEPLLDMEPLTRDDAPQMQWMTSPDVAVRDRPPEVVRSGESDVCLDVLADALRAIPNDGDGMDYDEWRNVIFGIHDADSGPDGFDLAERFSARSDKHDPAFLENRIWPYIRTERTERVTARTVLAKAREHGWSEPEWAIARDFEVSTEPEEDEPAELPQLDRQKDGAIKATLPNIVSILRRAEHTGLKIGRDEFTDSLMLARATSDQWRPARDDDFVRLRIRMEQLGFKPISKELMRDAALMVAEENRFDSAYQWLDKVIPAWDGVPRIERFLPDYFGAEDREYTRAAGLYLWTALAGRVLSPGCKADMIPIAHGLQGVGKSEGIKAMVPDERFFFEVSLRADDDALARQMRGKLVGELDELRGMRARDIEHMKSFASRRYEEWVPKYQEFTTQFPRRCVFIGTTNAQEFLMDETGHRRFLPFVSSWVAVDRIRRDQHQLWAEARETWRKQGVLYREAERLAQGEHEQFVVEDPWRGAIERWLEEPTMDHEMVGDEGPARGEQPIRTDDVIQGALHMAHSQMTNVVATRIGVILRQLGYERQRVRVDGQRVKRWMKVM